MEESHLLAEAFLVVCEFCINSIHEKWENWTIALFKKSC